MRKSVLLQDYFQQLRWRVILVFLLGGLALSLAVPNSRAHEPITTKITFNKEVARILQRYCWECHSPQGFKADIPLTTYEEARPWAKAIKEEILERRMPVYQAVPGYGQFQHDYVLPRRMVEQLVSWIDGGAPRGNASDYPAPLPPWVFGTPDAILQPATQFSLTTASAVQCFRLPTNFAEARWIRGFQFRPGNAAIVERATIALEPTGAVNTCTPAQLQSDSAALGYWNPQQAAVLFPAGVAQRLPAGATVRLTIQYRRNGETTAGAALTETSAPAGNTTETLPALTDQSQLGFYFVMSQEAAPTMAKSNARRSAVRSLRQMLLRPAPTPLLVSEQPQRIIATQRLPRAVTLVALRPLLFPYAQSVQVNAYYPNGVVEVLVLARDYQFAWQPSYYQQTPRLLPAGTRLEAVAYLQNNLANARNPHQPPRQITFADALCEIQVAD